MEMDWDEMNTSTLRRIDPQGRLPPEQHDRWVDLTVQQYQLWAASDMEHGIVGAAGCCWTSGVQLGGCCGHMLQLVKCSLAQPLHACNY